jgi:EmrB/QacA subfamily drug resistance transporter
VPQVNTGWRQWGVLAAATLALGMMTIDVSIVRVALPTIQDDLELSDAAQQWIVNAYLLTMGTLAIAGGRAGDRFGRRSVFLIGVGVFVSCSILAGLSESGGTMIAARAGQGVGAAIMTPGNIAMVTDAFSGRQLAKAMGVLVGIGSIGVSVGALVGGALIELASWRWVFFINVPVSAMVIALVAANVPETRADRAPGLDLPGLTTLVVGMTALTYGLVQAPVWGFGSAPALAVGLIAVGSLSAWLWLESRAADPLVDPQVLRGPMLGGNFVAFCVPFVLSGLSVFLAIYLQNVLGYTALEAGIRMLPLTVPGLIGSLLSGRLTAWLGARTVITGGMALATAGVFLVGVGADIRAYEYGAVVPGLVIFAAASGAALPPMTATIMASATLPERGMVSGVYNTSRLIGSTLGLAAMGSLLGSLEAARIADEQSHGRLTTAEAGHVRHLLGGGESLQEFKALGRRDERETERGMRDVFDSSFATTAKLASIVSAIGAAIAFFVVPRLRAPPDEPAMGQSPIAEA